MDEVIVVCSWVTFTWGDSHRGTLTGGGGEFYDTGASHQGEKLFEIVSLVF